MIFIISALLLRKGIATNMTKFQSSIKRLSDKENALGAAIVFVYRMCVSANFQTVINFICTLIIGKFSFTADLHANWKFIV